MKRRRSFFFFRLVLLFRCDDPRSSFSPFCISSCPSLGVVVVCAWDSPGGKQAGHEERDGGEEMC